MRARGTIGSRLPRTPCISTKAPPPGRPAMNQPRIIAPEPD
jgi:hypothetical protein